jgi:hypothetical protein
MLKEKKGYWKLKEEALDRNLWRTRFGRGYGPVVRQDCRMKRLRTCRKTDCGAEEWIKDRQVRHVKRNCVEKISGLAFKRCTFCLQSTLIRFIWISEQTAIISLYNIIWLVCITETECVYCAVQTVCFPIQQQSTDRMDLSDSKQARMTECFEQDGRVTYSVGNALNSCATTSFSIGTACI